MVEMVCLHVISLMEALQECNSTIFVKVCYDFLTFFNTINMITLTSYVILNHPNSFL